MAPKRPLIQLIILLRRIEFIYLNVFGREVS